jgi:hypothetical protein
MAGPPEPKAAKRSKPVQRYTSPSSGESVELWDARGEFLYAVARLAPEVLLSLRRQVAPTYHDVASAVRYLDPTLAEQIGPSGRTVVPAPECDVGLELLHWETSHKLLQELNRWSEQCYLSARYHTKDHWVLEAAIQTLQVWEVEHWLSEPPRFVRPLWWRTALREKERKITFTYPYGWEPTAERQRAATERLVKQFASELDQHFDKLALLAKERGFVPFHQKREPLHFEWLVRFQVLGERYREIAEKPGGGQKPKAESVEIAVKRLGQDIGLTPRSHPPGRPRGSRTAKKRSAETR